MSWNPVLNKVIEVKRAWEQLPRTDAFRPMPTFSKMLEELNNEGFNSVFDCLQINQDGNFILIRYGLAEMQEGLWDDPNSIYRECRSVVIDIKNECLVLTPFRKFFNLNEVEENKLVHVKEKIRCAQGVSFANKLDGSMQSARWYNDKVFMAGSMSLNPRDSWRLEEGYKLLTDNHIRMIQINPNTTFIFEFIHPKDVHVVKYESNEKGLYLIGIRDTKTGEEETPFVVRGVARRYNIPYAEVEQVTLEQVLEDMKTIPANEKEGWVMNIDGHKIKIKCDDYVNLHNLLDKISSINVVIKNVAEDRVDDMLSKIPEAYRGRTERLVQVINEWKVNKESIVKQWYYSALANRDNKKEFMIWVDSNVPLEHRGHVKSLYLGKEFNVLKNSGGGYRKISQIGLQDKVMEVLENE